MKVTIIGAGTWGQAIGFICKNSAHEIAYWTRARPELPTYSDVFIIAVPAQHVREVLSQINVGPVPVISAAKGIERTSGKLMAEVIREIHPSTTVYALSGPSFAADVVKGLPTAVAMAGPSLERAMHFATAFSTKTFRIYPTNDILGVEIAGAMKNVLAIACGICEGQGLGDSARASLVTRGFAELSRYARARGARPETLMGLSGFGDLMLTCSSPQSRNYAYGLAIGKGQSPGEAEAHAKGVVEGAYTAAIAARLAVAENIDMPIINAVAAIIAGQSSPRVEITRLLSRPLRAEQE